MEHPMESNSSSSEQAILHNISQVVSGPIVKRERADITRPNRLEAFSDAVFATAATLLVIPIRKFELEPHEQLKDALLRNWIQMIVFLIGFLVICTIWESHIIRYKLVSKVDDMVVFFTLVSLMVTTFLPFTVELVGHFGTYSLSILLNGFMLISLEIIESIIIVYAFKNPKLLSSRFKELSPQEQKLKKWQLVIKIALNSVIFILAIIFSEISVICSSLLLGFVILTPFLRRILVKLSQKLPYFIDAPSSSYEVLTGRISKERIEIFSDAATAIVATLLILDLTTEEFPKTAEVEKEGLSKVLSKMWQMFVSYIGTYATVGFLWFVHHSIMQPIKTFTPLMTLINSIYLAFLAGTPFISTLVNKFTGEASHASQVAVRVSSLILFLGSSMQLLLLTCAYWQKQNTFYSWSVPGVNSSFSARSHRYLLLKTLIIPIMTLVTFLSAFGDEDATNYIYHTALFFVPLAFIFLKILYACHCSTYCCQSNATSDDDNISQQSFISDVSSTVNDNHSVVNRNKNAEHV